MAIEGTWVGEATCCRVWPVLQPVAFFPLRRCGLCGEVPTITKGDIEADAIASGQMSAIVGNACPCFGCQCEPNQVTKDAIEEARNRNDTR